MARPREFDEADALDAAVECFWERGYEATSVRDLAGRMGLAGASLYNAFGDKRALFRRALTHYARPMHGRTAYLADTLPPLDALRAFFADIVARSAGDPHARGCMLVNAALDARTDDPALRGAIGAELAVLEGFFRRQVAAGQADGSIAASPSPDAAAAMLLAVLLGLRVLARARPDRAVLAHAADAALAALVP